MFNRLVLIIAMAMGMAAMNRPSLAADPHGSEIHPAAAQGGHEKPDVLPNMGSSETYMQALWVVIIFVVLLAVLYPTAWKTFWRD